MLIRYSTSRFMDSGLWTLQDEAIDFCATTLRLVSLAYRSPSTLYVWACYLQAHSVYYKLELGLNKLSLSSTRSPPTVSFYLGADPVVGSWDGSQGLQLDDTLLKAVVSNVELLRRVLVALCVKSEIDRRQWSN